HGSAPLLTFAGQLHHLTSPNPAYRTDSGGVKGYGLIDITTGQRVANRRAGRDLPDAFIRYPQPASMPHAAGDRRQAFHAGLRSRAMSPRMWIQGIGLRGLASFRPCSQVKVVFGSWLGSAFITGRLREM